MFTVPTKEEDVPTPYVAKPEVPAPQKLATHLATMAEPAPMVDPTLVKSHTSTPVPTTSPA